MGNVSGPEFTRGDCVRLIKRLIVYPTTTALVPLRRDNRPNWAANTWKIDSGPSNHPGETCGWGPGCYWPEQGPTPSRADVIVDAGQCSGSALARCWTNSPPIRLKVV